jgi:molybdenum cofactor cytidylyltransferase
MSTTAKIPGIILAAGLSTRMGEPKQLLPFGDSTIIETVIDNMLGSELDEVIVIIGHESEKVHEKIRHKPIKVVFNPNYHEGMLTSAQCGVRALPDCADAFALMLVDQPFITSDLINRVVDTYKDTDKGIALPSYNYRRGHPAIFDRRYASDIFALELESGGIRSLFKKNADDIHYVIVDTNRVLKDIDYRKDYEEALQDERVMQ